MIKLTREDLDKMHRQRKGVSGEIYYIIENEKELYFKANNQGFLYRTVVLQNEITGDESQSELTKVEKYNREQIISMLDYLSEMKEMDIITVVDSKVSKCKSLLDNIVFSL